jgi:hypothetical protein
MRQRIDEVTVQEVNIVAHLLSNRYEAAVLGPHNAKRSLPQQLQSLAR